MDRRKLTRELDLYIKQNYRPEGFKLKDFIGVGKVGATIDAPMGGAKWALSFLLDKLEMTFSEKLIQLIEKKGRKPAEVYTKAGVTKAHFSNHGQSRTEAPGTRLPAGVCPGGGVKP